MSGRSKSRMEDEAQRWVVRMHSDQVTLDDEDAFAAWLRECDEHQNIYEEQVAIWAGIGVCREDASLRAELAQFREEGADSAVTSRRAFLAASLAGGAVLVGGGYLAWRTFRVDTYQTAIGEQRRVLLADGTAVTLNTDTLVRVQYGQDERRLWLDRGQAFFSVASDAARPFRVFVGEDEVRAIGTAFDIARQGDTACVTLEDGIVEIYRNASLESIVESVPRLPAATLERGQQLIVAPNETSRPTMVDTRRTGAWRFGQMVLEANTLAYAVAEINRYNTRQIVIVDPAVGEIAINGVFQTGRPEAFVEALTVAFPVEVESETADAIYLRSAR